ncbi:MAG: hypothetical protein HOC60_05010 [Rhodospirillaceae bacterium]|nr:hypothetical protein [Rhodospirillaceae bacterium]
MNFLAAGDANYFFLLKQNCIQVRALYPDARILIYDFGLTGSQVAELERSFQPLEVIDWKSRIEDIGDFSAHASTEQRHKLALAFNERKRGFKKRFRKFILKRFPGSAASKAAENRALRFENLLAQKIRCMRDASGRIGAEPLVFLDSDAMLFKPIDDVFTDDADVSLTLIDNISWQQNFCFVLNSGVIYFGANVPARDALLDAWWGETLVNQEWLREQTALVRLLERAGGQEMFKNYHTESLNLGGVDVRVRMLPCAEYNFYDMENVEPEDFPDARIYHFTGRRQQPAMFASIMDYLRRR